ncbi:glycosyl hydrolase [Arthrobacter echini]|uniref:Glycosyl hydrolase n=1 Tax=Arthrobacter echini TaxID=1529066 RepID=A0A4S5E342_9MICC|nr:glycoside hydrolase family 76 protein [Arthrobacter echini]THJ65783.1 glycosyl hydrolase [Arthrobacter echini]
MRIPDGAAADAARSVRELFSRRVLCLPMTRIGAVAFPSSGFPCGQWHYWWQAHFLDCLIDEHLRDPSGNALSEARKLARGIWLRNGARWRNAYYDDMAWLALALQRLDEVEGRSTPRRPVRILGDALRSAHTQDLGGGVFWNTSRDFKNTPSTAPAALFFARAGESERAQELLDWLREHLFDTGSGLYLDGVRTDGSVETTLHTYNQGTVLGALIAVGGRTDLRQAGDLVRSIARGMADDDGVLPLDARGDGGLFTGILCRYLAQAVVAGIDQSASSTARNLLEATAAHIWNGRTQLDREGLLFPPPQGGAVSLSSQLQAWMTLEAERASR